MTMTKDDDFEPPNGNDEDDDPPTVEPSPDAPTAVDSESVEPISSPNSTDEGEMPSDVVDTTKDTIDKLRQQIKRLQAMIDSRKVSYSAALARREKAHTKKETQSQKQIADGLLKINILKSNLRTAKDECRAKIAATELRSRVKINTTVSQSKESVRCLTKQLREARLDAQTTQTSLSKMDAKMKLLTKKFEALCTNNAKATAEAKHYKLVARKAATELKQTKKKVDGQIALKLKAQERAASLALKREKVGLKRDVTNKRRKAELINLEHSKKLHLQDHCLQCLLRAAKMKSEDKMKEQQNNIDKAAKRIKVAHQLHSGQFPNMRGSETNGFSSIQEVSSMLF